MSKRKIDTFFGDLDMREDIWKSMTIIKDPVVSQYKTVKGSTEWVDKEVMSMIDDGWHVLGLPHSLSVSNNIVVTQTMVKYARVACTTS